MRQKVKEYLKKYVKDQGYVVEIGSGECIADLFEEADDFCKIDMHRGVGIDIVSDFVDIDRLFDYEPDTIVCVDLFAHTKRYKKVISAIRDTLIPGGFIIVFFPKTDGGSYIDSLFNGYEVFDVSTDDTMICGIAMKPYRITHDPKTD